MLGADLLAFQTEPDAENFLASVRQFLELYRRRPAPHRRRGTRDLRDRAADRHRPCGVPAQSRDLEVRARATRLRETLGADVVMLGVDRLDYTKGILERLRGYERFLERHPTGAAASPRPDAVLSRDRVPDYGELKRMVDEAVGRIAGRFTYDGDRRLYMYAALGRQALAAYTAPPTSRQTRCATA
jgi:trehalose-6-phosphate synthase